jgi:hypothetical protein
MTFEKQFCKRCTGIHFCILVGHDYYCNACFDTVSHDSETREQIAKIMNQLPSMENE